MTTQSAESLQQQLSSYLTLHSLRVEARPDLCYDLSIVLEIDENGNRIRVIFRDVRNLRLNAFGGGLTQIRGIRVENSSARQWDRVRYHITELEDETHFACNCFDITVEA